MWTLKLLKAFILFAVPTAVFSQEECRVTINDGTILGHTQTIWDPPKEICSYTAIPYASPPIENLRFKAPTPPTPFGFLNATSKPNFCPQAGGPAPGFEMSEDCLYLNVYVPKAFQAPLPVMVWIHGGGYTGGSVELYSPDKLVGHEDIILVVIHYRLGLLGFLNTQDFNSPGNYGLKDQSFAIRWVKNNIASFGGSPEKLTIFGESAGGSAVMYQLISPLNKGLINGVISQSGTALTPWALDDAPLESAKTISSYLDCPTNSTTEMVDCLRNTSWEEIINAQTYVNFILRIGNYQLPTAGVVPSVEPNLAGAFISKHPLEIMETGEFDNIPVMIGANKHDGSFVLGTVYNGNIGDWGRDNDPDYMKYELVPNLLKLFRIYDDEGNRAGAASIEMTYLRGVNRSSWEESMPGLVDIVTTFAYKSSALNSADLLTKKGHKVFLYSMDHFGKLSMWESFFPDPNTRPPIQPGVTHGDDVLYLFEWGQGEIEGDDKVFERIMLDMWTSFAKSGNPTPEGSELEWVEYDRNHEYYMKLNVTPIIRENYRDSFRPNGFGSD